MADIELAKSLFGSSEEETGKTTILFGIALADSANGEVLVRIDDELTASSYEDEEEDGFEVDIENEEDAILEVGEDEEEEALGPDDDQYEDGEIVEEEDQDSDSVDVEDGGE